ncbi:helix-turn-helix domain-containing protein [Streptomyces albicerus]|uniref:helix-turn-helix domain-containing protein n=1 Tax=Streptomyces albicerus TaxID=2569859 RepID=UPI001CECBA44|nr:LysR family transcriptional regulator [Streptomyces albicerus]
MLNLTHLKVPEAVARHGSATEAAKELHYSQPSVSRHRSQAHPTSGPRYPTHPRRQTPRTTGDRDPGTS